LSPGGTRPLVVTVLDTVEDSSGFILNNSEATTTVVPVKHATTRAVVYSNSGPGDPIIIIEEDDGEKCPVMEPNAAGEPGCLERDAQDATVTTVVAGAEQKIRTGRWCNQISDPCEDSVTSTPIVGGTSMGMLDAVACAAEHADPVVNTPDTYGLWAPTEEMTCRNCGYFGEAVEPAVDPSLLDEAQAHDKDGMPLIGSVATALGANDCFSITEECSTGPYLQHRSGSQLGDGMSPIKPSVTSENVEKEMSGSYELSPSSMIVGGRKMHEFD